LRCRSSLSSASLPDGWLGTPKHFGGEKYAQRGITGTGNAAANLIRGNYNNNTILGLGGIDTLYGSYGDDSFDGGAGTDSFFGGDGRDTVTYASNTTSVKVDLVVNRVSFPGSTWPQESTNSIESAITGSGADTLIGNAATNDFRGGAGADRFTGGGGADRIVGGLGNDTFVFATGDSTPSARDVFAAGDNAAAFEQAGANPGDKFDLTAIDAKTNTTVNDVFVLGGSGIGRLTLSNAGSNTVVRGQTDTDTPYEVEFVIEDGAMVAAANYTKADFML
jgi:serralysin